MKTLSSRLRHPHTALEHLLDLVFPPSCVGCHQRGAVMCMACRAHIQPLPQPFCQRCSAPLTSYGTCQACRAHSLRLSGLRAVSLYREPLRSFIHALKYEGQTRLAEPLGGLLAQAYSSYGIGADAIIPVPLHPERLRQRGYNHAQLLAECFAAQVHIPLYNDVLVRERATPAQVGLNFGQRQQNVAGAFTCTPVFANGPLFGRTIVIIDDVCTTGSTLEACAAPLFVAGARAVWGLVLARPSS